MQVWIWFQAVGRCTMAVHEDALAWFGVSH